MSRSIRLTALASVLAASPAGAQQTVRLDEISVEAARTRPGAGPGGANVSVGDGTASATSSGGGGPSGVTGYVARVSPTATKTTPR